MKESNCARTTDTSTSTPLRTRIHSPSSQTSSTKDAKLFTKFDIQSGYNNIRIREGDEWKVAFITPKGLFEPTVMFFRLLNSPATFQRFMNDLFKDMIAEGWLIVYMDDMLITS